MEAEGVSVDRNIYVHSVFEYKGLVVENHHYLAAMKLLCDWALFIGKNPSLDWERFWRYSDEFGMLRFAQSMTRLSCRLLGASVPFELPEDTEADALFKESLWDLPTGSSVASGRGSLFSRRLGIISNLMHARKRYKVFYDISSLGMILAYVRGYLFGGEE